MNVSVREYFAGTSQQLVVVVEAKLSLSIVYFEGVGVLRLFKQLKPLLVISVLWLEERS